MGYVEKERPFRHEFASIDAMKAAIVAASRAMIDGFPDDSYRDAAVRGTSGTGKSETGDLRDALAVVDNEAASGWFVVRKDLGQPKTYKDARLEFTAAGTGVVTGWVKSADEEWITGLADQLEDIFEAHDA